MITFKRKRRQIHLEGLVLGLLILTVTGFLALSNWRMLQRRRQLLARIEGLEKEIQILGKENQELQEGISQSFERTYLEKEAIERFNLKPEGTQVVVIKKEEKEEETVQPLKSFWQNFLEILEKLKIK